MMIFNYISNGSALVILQSQLIKIYTHIYMHKIYIYIGACAMDEDQS